MCHVWLSDAQEYTDGQNYLSTSRTTDAKRSLFSLEFRNFGLGQIDWGDKFCGTWNIVSPTFLQETPYLFRIGI